MHHPVRFADGADHVLEGLLVPYGGSFNGRDSYGTYATPRTRFCLDLFPDGARPLLYHHGLDAGVGATPVGRIVTLALREAGVWMQAQLDKRNQYVREIKELVKKGALGLSSGALAHLVEIDARTGEWVQWPIVEGSLTPAPANLLATVDLGTFKSHARAAGIDLPSSALARVEQRRDRRSGRDWRTTPYQGSPLQREARRLMRAHQRLELEELQRFLADLERQEHERQVGTFLAMSPAERSAAVRDLLAEGRRLSVELGP